MLSPPGVKGMSAQFTYRDLYHEPPASRHGVTKLSPKLYYLVVVGTGSLAVAQYFFLPNNLGATEFGYVVLGLSMIQAGLQLTDLGLVNASFRTDIAADTRVALRINAITVCTLICAGGIAACAVAGVFGHTSAFVAAAALVCAMWLIGDRANSSASAQRGNERTTTRYNIVWQNSPKAGTILGSMAGTALAAMLGAIVTSLLFSRPQLPRRPQWAFLRATRHLWLPGFAVSLTAFLLTWTETYILSAIVGIDEAGTYQAVVRPLTGITYLYLPIVALIQAAHNGSAHRRVLRLTGAAVTVGVAGSAAIAVFLLTLGQKIWPDFTFELSVVAFAAVASAAMCTASLAGTQLLLRGHHVAASANSVLGAAVLIVVSVLTIGSMGATGAAVASASAWVVVTICHVVVLVSVRRRNRGVLR